MPFVRSNNQLTEGCYLQEEFAIFSLIGSFSFSGKSIVNYAQCANWTHSISVHSRNLFYVPYKLRLSRDHVCWTHVKTRSRRQRERTTSAVDAVFIFVYTEDMYKMMRDTNRQLEDNIGPAVPVCIASGRSPVIQRHSG